MLKKKISEILGAKIRKSYEFAKKNLFIFHNSQINSNFAMNYLTNET